MNNANLFVAGLAVGIIIFWAIIVSIREYDMDKIGDRIGGLLFKTRIAK